MRVIKEHNVFGRSIKVTAANEAQARIEVRKVTSDWIWELLADEKVPSQWNAYVAKHEDCFATND
jgi:hypothetical protein